ncbi:beta-ketoacyl-[acyl-carrier-protein] synthase family protein [Streptomyces gobiensis]|uniref:beta-ketoacyl-[acyl-carrier-protein] synthase family protein n=1 Tax=Streptomyces gobiensis TaxID=2875706 RepID=UPI001E553B6D|nr:beta-ketoacyl synthase N-terminal-like domain-containing protein [Streptomyces gobiensis]UGY94137.1 beta-ketoacyl-[acyl-carrier-protein] synthase family protein [Streptomyces gobiensis]
MSRTDRVAGTAFEGVVITGLGFVLPGADTPEQVWRHLREGESQLSTLPPVISGRTGIQSGGRLTDFNHTPYLPDLPDNFAKRYSREILIVLSAVQNAFRDAGFEGGDALEPARTGVVASSARGPVEWWSQTASGMVYEPGCPPVSSAQGVFASLAGTPASLSAIRLDAQGLVSTISNACVGGHQALGIAAQEIQRGAADVMFVVGHELPIVPEVLQVYSAPGTGVLSRDTNPKRAIKPYDINRDGFALGEGAVVAVLERSTHATARRARAYATLRACHSVSEAAHATRMDLSGRSTAQLMTQTMDAMGSSVGELDYICGHGTATRYNDLAESRALSHVYGPHRSDWPPLGSIKPVFGHLLGAAGLLNCAALALMLHERCLAPTINCEAMESECDHDHVTEGARPAELRLAMSLAFAIGSQSSALVLEAAA